MQGVRNVCAILLVAAVAAGCGTPIRGMAYDVEGHAAVPWDTRPVDTQDKGFRKVKASGGEALAWVPAETAAQVICQAVGKDDWAGLLGSPVGREVSMEHTPNCRITGERVYMTFRRSLDSLGQFKPSGPTTELVVGGRKARAYVSDSGPHTGEVAFALTEAGERAEGKPVPFRASVVTFQFGTGEAGYYDRADAFKQMIVRVLEKLVPVLTRSDVVLPQADEKGDAAFAVTPVEGGGQIVDAPTVLQGLQLCTAALQQTGQDPAAVEVRVEFRGWCTVRPAVGEGTYVLVYLTDNSSGLGAEVAPVGGRKAWSREGNQVDVRVREDVPLWLHVSMRVDPRGFAEKLVPLLV
jgi:hypothetical protein